MEDLSKTRCHTDNHRFEQAGTKIFCHFCGEVRSLEIDTSFQKRLEEVEQRAQKKAEDKVKQLEKRKEDNVRQNLWMNDFAKLCVDESRAKVEAMIKAETDLLLEQCRGLKSGDVLNISPKTFPCLYGSKSTFSQVLKLQGFRLFQFGLGQECKVCLSSDNIEEKESVIFC